MEDFTVHCTRTQSIIYCTLYISLHIHFICSPPDGLSVASIVPINFPNGPSRRRAIKFEIYNTNWSSKNNAYLRFTLDTTGVGNNTVRICKLKLSCRAPAGDSSTREEFTCRPPEKKSCGEVHRSCSLELHWPLTYSYNTARFEALLRCARVG